MAQVKRRGDSGPTLPRAFKIGKSSDLQPPYLTYGCGDQQFIFNECLFTIKGKLAQNCKIMNHFNLICRCGEILKLHFKNISL